MKRRLQTSSLWKSEECRKDFGNEGYPHPQAKRHDKTPAGSG